MLKERRLNIEFRVCLRSQALRKKNIPCIKRMFGLARFKNKEYTLYLAFVRGINIVFSMYLGLHASRTKNIHCIQRLFGLTHFKSKEYTFTQQVFGIARFKNEEYMLYLVFVWDTLYFMFGTAFFTPKTINCNDLALLGLHSHCMQFTDSIPIDCLLFHWCH